ncbi:MAG: hypothetical protein ACRD22_01405, partial [Terriglobia bacterium]
MIGAEVEHRGEGTRGREPCPAPAPIGSAVEGLPAGLLRTGYRHSAAPARCRRLGVRRTGVLVGFAQTVAAEQEDFGV